MTHICVSRLTIIGPDNGLLPDRRLAIIWTNAGILLIGPLETNFSEILIEMLIFSFKKMRLKVSSVKRRPFCLGLNMLTVKSIVFPPTFHLLNPRFLNAFAVDHTHLRRESRHPASERLSHSFVWRAVRIWQRRVRDTPACPPVINNLPLFYQSVHSISHCLLRLTRCCATTVCSCNHFEPLG